MSSISSYLTTNNIIYTSAVCTLGAIFGTTYIEDDRRLTSVIGTATLAGITAVVIKEKSFQSSKWAILTIGVLFAARLMKEYKSLKTKEPKKRIEACFDFVSVGALVYAPISIIAIVGARIFHPMQQS